jgi:hypothetical protein
MEEASGRSWVLGVENAVKTSEGQISVSFAWPLRLPASLPSSLPLSLPPTLPPSFSPSPLLSFFLPTAPCLSGGERRGWTFA